MSLHYEYADHVWVRYTYPDCTVEYRSLSRGLIVRLNPITGLWRIETPKRARKESYIFVYDAMAACVAQDRKERASAATRAAIIRELYYWLPIIVAAAVLATGIVWVCFYDV